MSQVPPLPTPPKTSGLAIASLVLGILSIFASCITGLPAVICGHVARSNIKNSNGQIGGAGLALSGLITGYVLSVIGLVVILAGLATPAALQATRRVETIKTINNTKMLKSSLDLYASSHSGDYPPSLKDLVSYSLLTATELDELVTVKTKSLPPQKIKYVPGLKQTSSGNLILLYSPTLLEDKAVLGRVDSSVISLETKKAHAELKAQGIAVP